MVSLQIQEISKAAAPDGAPSRRINYPPSGRDHDLNPTEVIFASDYLFRKSGWQHFDEKRQPNFKKRPFQTLIDDLICRECPKKSLFSNDTTKDIRKDVLGIVGE
jgi:hypothetical protein